jgi:hypothetical protein
MTTLCFSRNVVMRGTVIGVREYVLQPEGSFKGTCFNDCAMSAIACCL